MTLIFAMKMVNWFLSEQDLIIFHFRNNLEDLLKDKRPGFYLYVGDWVQDTAPLSLSAKGAWIDILCALWRSQNRGTLTMSHLGWARTIRATVEQTEAVIQELVDMKVCNCVKFDNGDVTLENRRMTREELDRLSTVFRQRRFRGKLEGDVCNATGCDDVTSPSSSSSSFSNKQTTASPLAIPDDFLSHW